MGDRSEWAVRVAGVDDADVIAQLLDAFNREFGEPTPGPDTLARRLAELMAGEDTTVLLGGSGPDGIAVLRFRRAIWAHGLECYLAELYVAPDHRGQGLGRALMDAALEVASKRGANYMDLNTS